MSSAVRDLAEAEFVGRRDDQNNPLPSIPPADRTGYAVAEWTLRNVLSAGALLGKSCQGTLKLAGHSDEMQEQGYKFGKHLALAWQVINELQPSCYSDVKESSICTLFVWIDKRVSMSRHVKWAQEFLFSLSNTATKYKYFTSENWLLNVYRLVWIWARSLVKIRLYRSVCAPHRSCFTSNMIPRF